MIDRGRLIPLLTLLVATFLMAHVHTSSGSYQCGTTSISNGDLWLTIRTIPNTANYGFEFDRESNQTCSTLTMLAKPPGNYTLEAAAQTQLSPGSIARFLKWGDLPDPQSFQPERVINLKSNQTVTLLLTLVDQVSISFADNNGNTISNSMVQNTVIQSSDGQSYILTSYDGLWFATNRFQRTPSDWKVINISYTVNSVNVTGRNVVQRGLNTYWPSPDATWTVPLLLYSLKLTVVDMLFGFPIEANVHITDLYTGGEVQTVHTQGGEAVLPTFPRGSYVLHVSGLGVALSVPVIFVGPMSQTVRMFSLIDAIFLMPVAGTIVLLIRRRESLVLQIRKRLRSSLS